MTLSHPDPGFLSLNPIRSDHQLFAVPQSYYLPLFPSVLTPILARPRCVCPVERGARCPSYPSYYYCLFAGDAKYGRVRTSLEMLYL